MNQDFGNRQTLLFIAFSLMGVLILVGCQSKTPSEVPLPQALPKNAPPMALPKDSPTEPSTPQIQTGDWDFSIQESTYVKAEIRKLRKEAEEAARNQLDAAQIVPIPPSETSSKYGVSLYQLKNSPGREQDVFIQPKIFVRSSVFGGRVYSSKNAFKQVTLRIPVALVDGLSRTISSGLSTVTLPDEYVIQDIDVFRDALSRELGFKPNLHPTSACPANMVLAFGDERLPVKSLLPRGVCPINQFFDVSVTGSESQIQKLIEQEMSSRSAQLVAVLGSAPQLLKEITDIQISGSHLREQIYKKFVELPYQLESGDFLLYPAASVRRGVEEVLTDILAEVGLSLTQKTDWVPWIDEILANYFDSEVCGEDLGVCLRPRSAPVINEPIVRWSVFDTENISKSAFVVGTTTTLRSLTTDESAFTAPFENTDDSVPPIQGRVAGLLRPVHEGDLVEFELTGISALRRQHSAPILDESLSHPENPVCVAWGDPPTRPEPDYSVCLEWNMGCSRSHEACVQNETYCGSGHRECVERGNGICFFCCKHVGDICDRWDVRCVRTETRCDEWTPTSCRTFGTRMVPAGPAPCIQTENQWSKFWRVSEVASIIKTPISPVAFDLESLSQGIQIQLTHWEPSEAGDYRLVKTVCPLSAFHPTTELREDLKIRFRLANNISANCFPFNSWNRKEGREPELAIINSLAKPERYECGFREEFWNGKVVYTCPKLERSSDRPIFDAYYPRLELRGILRLPGTSFVSTEKGIEP